MGRVTIADQSGLQQASAEQSEVWCRKLEEGNILFFPESPISIQPEDRSFLLTLQQTSSGLHKNMAYKPGVDRVSGADIKGAVPESAERLHRILRAYSQHVTEFLAVFLRPYEARWHLDYGSFRPQEEQGRDLPLRRRNDLMHTDAFPTRPTRGARILRFFTNLNPARTRDWITGEPFKTLLPQFAPQQIALPRKQSTVAKLATDVACGIGLGKAIPALKRSPYDEFMMRFHNFLKENENYQVSGKRESWYFPPGSSWMVYTDMVPHAVLAGQYALEQTYLVAPEAMIAPGHSPLGVLQAMTGQKLV
ncbi:MAG TPA: Kdo hydroxylase family protein [Acidobacteriaceae bacterium]|nr:Kdo hydroxylase family protein [Acidobacteriaceae bacterium]